MPVMDEFREEREAIKNGTFKQKYQYFKDYYRTPLIIIAVLVIVAGSFLYSVVTQKEPALYAVMLNCAPFDENRWFTEEYADKAGIDLNKYRIVFDTMAGYKLNSYDEDTYATIQKLDVYSSAGDLDIMMGAGDEFGRFANNILFMDLRNALTTEQIQKYEPYFYYIDAALTERLNAAAAEKENWDAALVPDPGRPEEMENPIPVALYVDHSDKLKRSYFFKNADSGVAIGIYYNTSRLENALSFIDYLMADES